LLLPFFLAMNMLGVPFAYFLASKTWLGKVLRKLLVTFH